MFCVLSQMKAATNAKCNITAACVTSAGELIAYFMVEIQSTTQPNVHTVALKGEEKGGSEKLLGGSPVLNYLLCDATLGRHYCSFAYSALASFRMGMLGSASFHSVRKFL